VPSDLGIVQPLETNFTLRGRPTIKLDLRDARAVRLVLKLVGKADCLIEGFRPGVMERLGLGPLPCRERNPRLVYARMTGWGQHGPLAAAAGHDLNYLALSGALAVLARPGHRPITPPGLVADFGGGGLLLAFGVVSALLEASRSGQGQVVDAAMVDGVASLTAMVHGFLAQGRWTDGTGADLPTAAAPFYDVYECADGRFLAVAADEPQFWALFLDGLGLDPQEVPDRADPQRWDFLRKLVDGVIRTRTRDEWAAVFDGTDACVTPVLGLTEATRHPHARAREVFTTAYSVVQPAPAPRFDRTPGAIAGPPPLPGEGGRAALLAWGLTDDEIAELSGTGAISVAPG